MVVTKRENFAPTVPLSEPQSLRSATNVAWRKARYFETRGSNRIGLQISCELQAVVSYNVKGKMSAYTFKSALGGKKLANAKLAVRNCRTCTSPVAMAGIKKVRSKCVH